MRSLKSSRRMNWKRYLGEGGGASANCQLPIVLYHSSDTNSQVGKGGLPRQILRNISYLHYGFAAGCEAVAPPRRNRLY
jgi:hypothetical protein